MKTIERDLQIENKRLREQLAESEKELEAAKAREAVLREALENVTNQYKWLYGHNNIDESSSEVVKMACKALSNPSPRAEAIQKALEVLAEVEDICNDAFTDEMGPGGHYTASFCPLCGGGSICDEDCPRPRIRAAIAKGNESIKTEN